MRRFYLITVLGTLSERLAPAFDGLQIEPGTGCTVLSGVCIDASAVHGVLDRVKELGLELVGVESFPVAPPTYAPHRGSQTPGGS